MRLIQKKKKTIKERSRGVVGKKRLIYRNFFQRNVILVNSVRVSNIIDSNIKEVKCFKKILTKA